MIAADAESHAVEDNVSIEDGGRKVFDVLPAEISSRHWIVLVVENDMTADASGAHVADQAIHDNRASASYIKTMGVTGDVMILQRQVLYGETIDDRAAFHAGIKIEHAVFRGCGFRAVDNSTYGSAR